MKKYFEFKNEVSNKFWEISQKGILVKVVFGRIGIQNPQEQIKEFINCLLYTSPSPRDRLLSRMPSSA